MRTITARALLDVWERAAGLPPGARALTLWSGLCGRRPAEASLLPVGQRERELLSLYGALFGRRLDCCAACPACEEMLDLNLDVDLFDVPPPALTAGWLSMDGLTIEWRLPTAGDLAACSVIKGLAGDRGGPRDLLLRRCITDVRRGDVPVDFDDWPAEIAAEVGQAMVAADPLVDPQVEATCAVCGQPWTMAFDVSLFLWQEIDAVARRLLSNVHRLATAYGWTEAAVLEMTATRRNTYLQMCGG